MRFNKTVVHLSSAHPRYDTRIFIKMCCSLAGGGYDVSLVVADGKGDEVLNTVNIYDVGPTEGGRLSRMTKTVDRVFAKAKVLNADLYHLHDPELMPVGLRLKALGKKVIFDAHEDLPKQLMGKHYLHPFLRRTFSFIFTHVERFLCPKFDAIVSATPVIRDKFLKINEKSIDINNYPILGELGDVNREVDWSDKFPEVCYVGAIADIRGGREIVKSLESVTGVGLNFAGAFSDSAFEAEVKSYDGWKRVIDHGFLDREQVREIMQRSIAGLVTFHNLPNHVDAQPNKMFEYMSAGLPIITSNFPRWRSLIEENNCGICVDPLDVNAISAAIKKLLDEPETARQMGANGKMAVLAKYNWQLEEKKLLDFYAELLG